MQKKIIFKFLFVLTLLVSGKSSIGQMVTNSRGAVNTQIQWPKITQNAKPRAYWWWMGSAVNKEDLAWNMRQYSDAGLGGLDIIPIYGVHGYEKEFITYLSPRWMGMLVYTLEQAQKCKLGIDMANGSGWIFGGPWITDKDAAKTIFYKTYSVSGGKELKETISYQQVALVRTSNNKPVSVYKLVKPISTNKDLQSLALDKVQFPVKLPLQLLMAYADNGTRLDLTSKLDVYGKLNWIAPRGKWTLYALFMGVQGKMVERPSPGGEGYGVDPFSSQAMHHYFKKFDQSFKGHNLSYLRALCNDSYELDDASGLTSQANWTPLFLSEFRKRRGYDLRNFLPALFNKDSPEMNSRVIYDYRITIDELLLEHFTLIWKNWATSKGMVTRNQAHGSPANILDLYSASDIPDCEGREIMDFKFASSAAHVTGEKLTSSETATWLNEHFQSSWGDVKKALDPYFLGGVNHIFYHSVTYSPQNAPWPGWMYYAAVHFQPTNPQWKDFHALNEYVTRCQSFLQTGQPDNDVLLYYPLADRLADPGSELLRYFHGTDQEFAGTYFRKIADWMLGKGYSFDFFSDRQLLNMSSYINQLKTRGSTYQAILLPANKFMSEVSFHKLVQLAKNGARILVYKKLPADIPGLSRLRERERIFHQLLNQLHFINVGKVKKAMIGKGFFFMSDNINDLLEAAGIRRELIVQEGLQFIRRRNADGYTYFVANRSDTAKEKWIPLSVPAATVALFDPASSVNGLAKYRKDNSGKLEILVQLQPFGSCIIRTYNTKTPGFPYPYIHLSGYTEKIEGDWTIEFTDGGPVLPSKQSITELGSWTELQGDDVKQFSGTAKYSIRFAKPLATSSKWLLDLGKVNETAEVFINKKRIATLIGPVFQTVIEESSLIKENLLEIYVSNLMSNRIIDMDKKGIEWKKFYDINFVPLNKNNKNQQGLFDASKWQPMSSGLTGPITLMQIK